MQVRTAAARGDHHCLCTGLQRRVPGIDIAAGHFATPLGVAQVMRQGAAAAGLRRALDTDPQAPKHDLQGVVDLGRQSRLHAAVQHQHPAFTRRSRRKTTRIPGHRHLPAQRRWQQRTHPLPPLRSKGVKRFG